MIRTRKATIVGTTAKRSGRMSASKDCRTAPKRTSEESEKLFFNNYGSDR